MRKSATKKGASAPKNADPAAVESTGTVTNTPDHSTAKGAQINSTPKKPLAWLLPTVICVGIVALLVGVWVVGNSFFGSFTVGYVRVPTRSSNQALHDALQKQAQAYRLAIAYPDGKTQYFPLAELGVQPNIDQTIAAARKQQSGWKHHLLWWRPMTISLAGPANIQTLNTFVRQKATISTLPAHDATLSIDNGTVQLANEAPGMQYAVPGGTAQVLNTARRLYPSALRLSVQSAEPAISTTTLTAQKSELEAVLKQKVDIHIGDQTVTATAADIGSWLTLTPNPSANKVDVSIDQDALHAFLNGLAKSHGQAARSQVTGPNGAIITAGQRGVAVTGTDAAANTIANSLLNAKNISVDLPVQYTAFKTVSSSSAGKWIEVDVTTKRMYAYQDGTLVRTFLVSAGAPATPTVVGRFAIYSKYASQDMQGSNADGTLYFQPHVPWVNYFYHDYAIHGNYWRPTSYFGAVNSSHGCVGVMVDDGKWIYDWAPIGTPVVVHT